jgi:hypothetical protein
MHYRSIRLEENGIWQRALSYIDTAVFIRWGNCRKLRGWALSKLDGEIMVITSKHSFGYQMPAPAGWSLGWVSAIDSEGRTIWIVNAHRDDGRRFIVRADEKLTAFVELERQVLTVTFYLESIQ